MKSAQIFYRLLAIGFLLLPGPARAEGFYIIGALGPTTEFTYGAHPDAGAPEVEGAMGHMLGFGKEFGEEFGEGLAVELFHAKPVASEATYTNGTSIDSNLTTAGLALKWHFYLSENSRGSLKVGYHSWELEHKSPGISTVIEDSGSDSLWGFDFEFQSNATLAWIVGYDGYSVEALSNNPDHSYFGVKLSF